MSNKTKKILTAIFFLAVNIAVLFVLIFTEDRSGNIGDGKVVLSLLKDNIFFTILSIAMFFVIVIGDTIVFKSLLKRLGKKPGPVLPLTVSVLGRYYDRITPWSVGGEPFQMGYLISHDVGAGDSCAVTMSRHIIRFIVTAVAVITILLSSGIATTLWVMIAAILSILCGLIVPVFMLVCAFKPNIGLAIGRWFIRVGHKIKLIKDYQKAEGKMQEEVNKFLSGIRFLSVNKGMIFLIGTVGLIELFANNCVPYFVMRAIGLTPDFWFVFVLCIFVNYASSFAPTPGGSGLAELSFYAIFASFVPDGQLFWAVLFWRISVFYIPVLIGFTVQVSRSVYLLVTSTNGGKNLPS